MIIRKLKKVGNSLVVSLPFQVVEILEIKDGENIQFITKDGEVALQKENNDKDFLKLLDKHFCEYDEALRKLSEL
ncbi:hypothetical protein HMPREF2578_05895 [Staphylococcus sp. HMSC072H03]|uniref:hypothetical protein n=1 Tax=Staphylococcus sp. HMSC072H03 TaxID=1715057 RepID=UPI0008C18E96|nr:hypothetical protein [Staphylococcus sp. HMSC072H03]OFN25155.1 hypothetical protein HMPREF2578_05895 [Staphylococcus sp. HMSC072H03]